VPVERGFSEAKKTLFLWVDAALGSGVLWPRIYPWMLDPEPQKVWFPGAITVDIF
jgi:hypothetical protein